MEPQAADEVAVVAAAGVAAEVSLTESDSHSTWEGTPMEDVAYPYRSDWNWDST